MRTLDQAARQQPLRSDVERALRLKTKVLNADLPPVGSLARQPLVFTQQRVESLAPTNAPIATAMAAMAAI
jgi:hypothetical protein